MTTPQGQSVPLAAGAFLAEDAEDAERAEPDGTEAAPRRDEHDADGAAVGRGDLRADVERSGGDPDSV